MTEKLPPWVTDNIPDDPQGPIGPKFSKPSGASAVYEYFQADGFPVFNVVRFDPVNGHDKKRFQQWSNTGAEWVPKMLVAAGARPLFNLLELNRYFGANVLVVEGEKTALAAMAIVPADWVVVTWAGGASAPKTADWEPLSQREVLIWPDNDAPGLAAAKVIQGILPQAHIVDVPLDFPEGWDLADPPPAGWDISPFFGIPGVRQPPRIIPPAPTATDTAEPIPFIRAGDRGTGPIKPILANVVMLLRAEPAFFSLRFDEFSQRAYRGDSLLSSVDFVDITNWVQHRGIYASVAVVADSVDLVAQQCRFHQVRDYLSSLTWDGTERIGKLFVDHGDAPDTAATYQMTLKWFIQAVARVFKPGCQADTMLILSGAQGLRKSSFFRAIGSPWVVDHLSDLATKDCKQELRGVWIVEMAELSTWKRTEVNQLKSFMTTPMDRYRDSYGRVAEEYPRQCVFAGSINPGGDGFLKDPTGARRFWIIKINEEIDVAMIAAKRDQLWAEALHRFNAGERWYIDDADVSAEIRAIHDENYSADIWEDVIAHYLIGLRQVTTSEILTNAIKNDNVAVWGKADQMRVGDCLTRLGWVRTKVMVGQKRVNGYVRGETKADESVQTNLL